MTLLVASGILAGPTILECSRQSGTIGACLRAKVQDAGLLPNEASSSSSAPLVSIQTTTPPVEARSQGWLEANANEYEGPASTGIAELAPPVGTIGAGGTLTVKPALQGRTTVHAPAGTVAAIGRTLPAPDAAADVALANPPGRLDAAGQLPSAANDRAAQVALAVPGGRLDASGKIVARPDGAVVDLSADPKAIGATGSAKPGTLDTSANVAIAAPTGRITLDGVGAPGTSASALADPSIAKGAASITGSLASGVAKHGTATLAAEAEIPQAVPPPVTVVPIAPALPTPKIVAKPKPPKAAVVVLPKTGPKRVLKADPRYPNVIVLPPPPPITAANSSFATLEIR